MKNQSRIFLATALLTASLVSCNKNESLVDNSSLKESISQSTLNLNTAMNTISASTAYKILTVTDEAKKSVSTDDSLYNVYITLDTIKGVFDYKPAFRPDKWGQPLIHFFTKTASNTGMLVRMPLEKVENPKSLRFFRPEDSTMTNNFSILVSDYHNNYNSYRDFDYVLASEISVDDVSAGNLNISYFKSPTLGIKYASQYVFTGSYTADYKYESGDTTVSSFSIKNNDEVLYEEKLLTVKNDTARFGREHQYILTIGDVMIVRKPGTQTVEVYLNGVLQPNAVIAIVDNEEDSEASVCKKRDIEISFEDGTSTTVSALIGSSVGSIKTLFDSLHDVYFAAYVVDWIAYDIYYQRN
jgi:hypothetical protein